ncbi:MAG: hypothetical protein B7X10_03010, partial [Burkholderiales bacterium 21-58-4]
MATASVSALLAFSAVGGAHAQAPVPTLALPDFTSVVAKTEGSVVNIRTTEAVPVRARGLAHARRSFPSTVISAMCVGGVGGVGGA